MQGSGRCSQCSRTRRPKGCHQAGGGLVLVRPEAAPRRAGRPAGGEREGSGAGGQGAEIEPCGVAPYFDRIIVEGEFGIGKPNREVYEALFASLRAEPAK